MKKDNINILREKNLQTRKEKFERKQEKEKNLQLKQNEKMKKYNNFIKNEKTLNEEYFHNEKKKNEIWYKEQVKKLNDRLSQVTDNQNESELKKLKEVVKPNIEKRADAIVQRFKLKREKISYKYDIASITEEEKDQQLQQINIDEALVLEKYDSKIMNIENLTTRGKIKTKLRKIEVLFKEKNSKIEKSNSAPTPGNSIEKIKFQYDNIRNKYIFSLSYGSIIDGIKKHFKKFSMFYILAFIIMFFSVQTANEILKGEKLVNIITSNSYIFVIGLGMLLVIVSGNIDLSVGSLIGYTGAFAVNIYNKTDSVTASLIATLLFGAAYGTFQGILIGYWKIPSFIVTLGGMLLFQGMLLLITKTGSLVPNTSDGELPLNTPLIQFFYKSIPDKTIGKFHIITFLIFLSMAAISALIMFFGRRTKEKFGIKGSNEIIFAAKVLSMCIMIIILGYLLANSLNGLQLYQLYILILVVAFLFITQNTRFGRNIYAIGGNKKAAELSGINVKLNTMLIFTVIGTLSAFAGMIVMARSATAAASTGSGYELDVISSVFVGGASMAGGVGTVPGTIIGGFILGYINEGMNMLNYAAANKLIVKAIVLVLAVGYDVFSHRKQG